VWDLADDWPLHEKVMTTGTRQFTLTGH